MGKWALVVAAGVMLAMAPAVARDATADAADTTPVDKGYRLGPGDKLRLTVYNEPSLSNVYSVTADGNIALPLIGDVPSSGLSLRELQDRISEKLAAYIKAPQVSAEPVGYRPYYILGEVNKPGEYPYSGGVTAEQAVAAAGGFTYRANRGVIRVRDSRTGAERYVKIRQRPYALKPGDTITVRERFL